MTNISTNGQQLHYSFHPSTTTVIPVETTGIESSQDIMKSMTIISSTTSGSTGKNTNTTTSSTTITTNTITSSTTDTTTVVSTSTLNSWMDSYENRNGLTRKDVKNWDALQKAIQEMGLRETYCKGVYCQRHNPDMPAGNYTHQKHYVWNDSTQQMVELPGIYYIGESGAQAKGLEGYELILAYKQSSNTTKTDLQKFEERLNGNEFDKDYNVEEAWNYIDEYIKLLSDDLNAKGIYSEEYLKKLINFIYDSIYSEVFWAIYDKYGTPEHGGINVRHFDGTLNLKNILDKLIKNCNELTKQPAANCNSETFKYSDSDITGQFLWSLITDTYYSNQDNINIPDVYKFTEFLTEYIAQEFGMTDDLQRNGYINFANIPDENCNGNWLDDLYNIINNFTHLNDNLDLNNTKTIDVESLFNDKDELSISELIEKIENVYLSGNAGLYKFGIIINNALKKFDIYNNYDKEDLIKNIVILMNKAAGIQNSYPVTISKDTIEQLNEKDIFDELDKIINSDELRDLYYFGVDGYIDDFCQGSTGDCWLIAAINTLNSSEAGKQIIKDSIKTDETGNITVTFKGIGISYIITPEEMVEARDAYAYSHGDNDVLALELATEKLRRDISAGKITLRHGNWGSNNEDDGSFGMGIWGGSQEYMLYYLTGNIPQVELSYPNSESQVIEFLNSIYNDFKTGNYAGYFSLGNNNVEATTVDNKKFTWSEGSYHAFSIIEMTEDTITIANPWYPDKPCTFSWEEFAKLMPYNAGIVSTKVHEHEYKTTWNNTIDYNSTFFINGQEYSLNDILTSNKAILFKTQNLADTNEYTKLFNMIKNISLAILSDVEPEIAEKIQTTLDNLYCSVINSVFYGSENSYYNAITSSYVDITLPIEHFGVSQANDGSTLTDIRCVVEKLLELFKLATKEKMTLDYYEQNLQGNEFNREVSQEELSIYVKEYQELLINNLRANYSYDEDYLKLINDFINENLICCCSPDGKFNLKYALNTVKSLFDEIQNTSSQECKIDNDTYYYNNNLSKFVSNIILNVFDNNRDSIDALNIYQFQEELIKYLAEKYGKTEELAQTGSIDLSKLIQDSNGDGNWLDEFFNIVKDFSHKDDNKTYDNTIDYDATFEYEGKEYTINDILSSSEPIILSSDNGSNALSQIYQILQQIRNTMNNVRPNLRNDILNTMMNYYVTYVDFCFNPENYYNNTVYIYNYIKNCGEELWLDNSAAKDFGITKTDTGVQIDLKYIVNKMLELLQQA